MSKKTKTVFKWIFAVVITLFFSVFQRMTGPTHSIMSSEDVNGVKVAYRLLRTQVTGESLPVKLRVKRDDLQIFLDYRRVSSDDKWGDNVQDMTIKGPGIYTASIPSQPIAGKVEYKIYLKMNGSNYYLRNGESVVARFKGAVPAYFLITHIVFMFLSILLTVRLGLELFFKEARYFKLVNLTVLMFTVGGCVLGPIVQYYAFGDAWTGFPYGTDLTDNKTLIALIFWILAFILKKKSKIWVSMAVIVMLLAYLVPHSVLGSELDYRTNKMNNKYGYYRVESVEIKNSGLNYKSILL
jgi:hypothetical protein